MLLTLAAVVAAALISAPEPPTPSVGVQPIRVRARAEAPDAVSLLKGRQAVQVRWRADDGGCEAPRFRVEVTGGEHGAVIARGDLSPSRRTVDWGGYALTLPYVPVTVLPLFARVKGCCGLTCSGGSQMVAVHTFLPAAIWTGEDAPLPPPGATPSTFLGTDGRGGVWLTRPVDGSFRWLPLLGDPVDLLPIGGRPLAVTGVEGRAWLTETGGIHAFYGGRSTSWSSVFQAESEPIRVAVHQSPLGSTSAEPAPGPCAIGTLGTIWCRLPGADRVEEVGRLTSAPVADARLVGSDLWVLASDGRLLRLRLDQWAEGLRTVLDRAALASLSGHRIPHVLGADPGTGDLWLADREGHLWRLTLDPDGEITFHAPISLPIPYSGITGVEADGRGRLAALTSTGPCTISGRAVGCRGEAHGWKPELVGMGWALPGVLWVGDTFLLTAPSSLPSLGLAYVSALVMGGVLTGLLGLLSVQRQRGRIAASLRSLVEALASAVAQDVGWGVAVSALLLPQLLVLAVDRLLGDLDLTATVALRIVPTSLFVMCYLGGVHRVRSWAEVARLAGRHQLPSFVLLTLVWALFLTLWVWPPSPRMTELDSMLSFMHLGLAVLTGIATLLYLVATLGRGRAAASPASP